MSRGRLSRKRSQRIGSLTGRFGGREVRGSVCSMVAKEADKREVTRSRLAVREVRRQKS